MTLYAAWAVVRCLLTVHLTSALYLEGRLETKKDWAFLGRFCFLSDVGKLQFKFTYPLEQCCNNLLLYYDDGIQWPSVYKNNSKNCFDKENVLQNANYQIINLTTEALWSGCETTHLHSELYLHCEAERSFRSVRERWWYMAISNCKRGLEDKGIDIKYELKLTNGHSFWREHFSADEFGILEADLFFFLLFALMLGLSIAIAVCLQERKLLHSTYKLFMICLSMEVFGLLISCIAFSTYASNGITNKPLKIVGTTIMAGGTWLLFRSHVPIVKLIALMRPEGRNRKSLNCLAELLFLLLLLLLGKGFTVTRGRLSYNGTIKLSVFITVYAVTDTVLFFYEYVFFDPGLVLYVYESPAGHGWIVLRMIAWLWFTYAVLVTVKRYPEKNTFYYPLYTIYTLWFYAVPIMALIAAYSIPKYMRAKLINGIRRLIDFLAYGVFLTLMRPQAANENFPYHVRTTQIHDANLNETGKAGNFRHNVYEEPTNDRKVYNLFTVTSNVDKKTTTPHLGSTIKNIDVTTNEVNGNKETRHPLHLEVPQNY